MPLQFKLPGCRLLPPQQQRRIGSSHYQNSPCRTTVLHSLYDTPANRRCPPVCVSQVIILVKAGAPVDATVAQLAEYMEPGDIIIDGGNEWCAGMVGRGAGVMRLLLSHASCCCCCCFCACAVMQACWRRGQQPTLPALASPPCDDRYENTERRQALMKEKGIFHIGMGVSGGEEGARNGAPLPLLLLLLLGVAGVGAGGAACLVVGRHAVRADRTGQVQLSPQHRL